MLIDCDTCAVRNVACDDCVVGVLLGTPDVPARDAAPADGTPREPGGPLPLEFGPVERRALDVLADHGLIPRLRLVQARPNDAAPAEDTRRASGGRGGARRTRGVG